MTADRLEVALRRTRSSAVAALRRYHRLEVTGDLREHDGPVLFISNHGFGSVLDLNVVSAFAALDEIDPSRSVTVLVHEIAWRLGLGPVMERLDAQPASRAAARDALDAGHHVLVFPGGDVDAFKPHQDRNRIVFSGRTGFARMAQEAGVPVVPITTSGAGDTLLALPGGEALAQSLGLHRSLRLKALPISVSIPWGVNVRLVGFLPYLPLPAKLRTHVLPPMYPVPSESDDDFAARIRAAMQDTLDDLSRGADLRSQP